MSDDTLEQRASDACRHTNVVNLVCMDCGIGVFVHAYDRDCPAIESAVREERERLQSWVNDLQRGMYINCVYCGHRYGPDHSTPATMADVLKEHIVVCPSHPLSAAVAHADAAERRLAGVVAAVREAGKRCYPCIGRGYLAPDLAFCGDGAKCGACAPLRAAVPEAFAEPADE